MLSRGVEALRELRGNQRLQACRPLSLDTVAIGRTGVGLRQQGRQLMDRSLLANRFRKLPKTIKIKDTIAQVDVRDAPDPDGGRDPDRDFLMRNAGFL